MNTIGSRIKQLRKLNELNQVDFSNKIGVSQGTLSELEQNKYKPSLEVLMTIINLNDTDLYWLVYGKVQSANEAMLSQIRLSRSEDKLIKMFRHLREEDKEDITEFIEIRLRRIKRNLN